MIITTKLKISHFPSLFWHFYAFYRAKNVLYLKNTDDKQYKVASMHDTRSLLQISCSIAKHEITWCDFKWEKEKLFLLFYSFWYEVVFRSR